MNPETFSFTVTMDDLLSLNGMEGLNETLDYELEQAGKTHFATDIAYEMQHVKDGVLTIKATYTPEDIG